MAGEHRTETPDLSWLRELEAAGLIAVDKRDIRILDSKQLAAYRA